MRKITLFIGLLTIFMIIGLSNVNATVMRLCYQESSTVPNQTGIDTGGCNLNYSGYSAIWQPLSALVGMLNDTFMKPQDATNNSEIIIKLGNSAISGNIERFAIPQTCWDYSDSITIVIMSQDDGYIGGGLKVWCYNGSSNPVYPLNYGETLYNANAGGVTNYFTPGGAGVEMIDGNWSTWSAYNGFYKYWGHTTDYSLTLNTTMNAAVWEIAIEWEVEMACEPDYTCSGYSTCYNGWSYCTNITDNNDCGVPYNDDGAEFLQQCGFTGENVSGWNELIEGNIVGSAYVMFNAAWGGWFFIFLLLTYELMLFIKTRNLGLTLITALVFSSMFLASGLIPGYTTAVLFILLIFMIGSILYYWFMR